MKKADRVEDVTLHVYAMERGEFAQLKVKPDQYLEWRRTFKHRGPLPSWIFPIPNSLLMAFGKL